MKNYILYIFIFPLLFAFSVHAQTLDDLDELDSPEAQIELLYDMAKPYLRKDADSALYYLNMALKISRKKSLEKFESKTFRNIGKVYYYKNDFDTCKYLYQQAFKISKQIDDYSGLADFYNRFAVIGYRTNNFPDAIANFSEMVHYASMANDSSGMAHGHLMIGACYYQNGNYPKALEAYQSALTVAESIQNLRTQAMALNNIGNIQDELKNYPLALQYLEQALEIKKLQGDEKGAMDTRENMANIYSRIGDYEHALHQYDSVLVFKQNVKDENGIGKTLMNIGFSYEKMGKFNNALDYYSRSLKIFYKLDDNMNIAKCLNNIGDIYYALGKYQQAIDSSEKSLSIGRKLQSKTNVKSSALSLTKSFVKRNQYKQAYEYHVLYSEMKDSLFNEQSAKQLQEMETKYQTEKKQQEIEKQKLTIDKQDAQARSQRIMLFAMLGGLVLVILIAVQVFRGYKQKKKANELLSAKNQEIEEKNIHLNQANVEISEQKAEIEEKNLNIMDSIRYAKRIQQTILPRDQFVEKLMPQSFILYKPKDIVSGDFYWVENVNQKVYVSAVDCTGHGVPGAFVSIVGYNSLNRTLMEFKLEKPGEILNKLNDLVVDTFVRHSDSDVKDGMDMSLISFDLKTKELEFAGAQNPLYIVNEDGIQEITANKQPIGSSLEPKHFDNHEIATKKGDMIYLFSDGYIDQFGGPKNKKFMRKRFKELLLSVYKMDVKTQKQHLDNTIIDWMGEEEQLDDILVIGIRV